MNDNIICKNNNTVNRLLHKPSVNGILAIVDNDLTVFNDEQGFVTRNIAGKPIIAKEPFVNSLNFLSQGVYNNYLFSNNNNSFYSLNNTVELNPGFYRLYLNIADNTSVTKVKLTVTNGNRKIKDNEIDITIYKQYSLAFVIFEKSKVTVSLTSIAPSNSYFNRGSYILLNSF